MLDYFDVLKASSGVPVGDPWAMVWAQVISTSDWTVTEITGTLPLTFLSKGDDLTDYRLYGTSEGVGVETENLWNGTIEQGYYNANSGTPTASDRYIRSTKVAVTPSMTYSIAYNCPKEGTTVGGTGIDGWFLRWTADETYIGYEQATLKEKQTFTLPNNAAFIAIMVGAGTDGTLSPDDISEIILVQGTTAPSSYIPYGYQIPLTNTGENSQSETYPLYIGSTKLGAEEYLDYEEQKVYKRTAQLFDENAITRNQSINYRTGVTFSSQSSYLSDYIDINNAVALSILISNSSGTTASQSSRGWCYFDAQQNFISGIIWVGRTATTTTFTVNSVPENAKYLRFSTDKNVDAITLVKGSTTPAQHIPYLQPTDPPVSLPAILTYQGENTLSSTETLGECSVTGKIKEAVPNG